MNKLYKQIYLVIVLCSLAVAIYLLQTSFVEDVTASSNNKSAIDGGQNWTNPIALTNAPKGAVFPVVRSSPDGKTVMVVFNRKNNEVDFDPYFTRSLDNGKNWSAPAAIYSNISDSGQVTLDYDANGIAHVAWQENKGLAYANEGAPNQGSWTNPFKVIVPGGGTPGVKDPAIVASGNNRLDIVWAQGSGSLPDPNIYHARSNNGGANWSSPAIVKTTGWPSQFPSVAVEQSGILHLVWQENESFSDPNQGTIYYVQGNVQTNGTIKWSTAIKLSGVPNPDIVDAREPKIIINGKDLHVTYTNYVSVSEEYLEHAYCSSQCTNINNWTSSQISGEKLGANGVIPLNIVSSLVSRGSCIYVYFHGIKSDLGSNELIQGVNSCNGWASGTRDIVTPANVQSVNPSLNVQNNWWMYLVYDQGTNEDNHQVYLRSNKPNLYLPIVFK